MLDREVLWRFAVGLGQAYESASLRRRLRQEREQMRRFLDRLDARLGTGSDLDAPYWMEAPLWQQACPTLVCGPSGGGLHAIDEWVDLAQVRSFTSALVAALAEGGPRGH